MIIWCRDGLKELMRFAKVVRGKCCYFDEQGIGIKTGYNKILKVVKDSGLSLDDPKGIELFVNNIE